MQNLRTFPQQLHRPLLRVVAIGEEMPPPYDASPPPERFAMIPAAVFALNDGTAIAVYAVLAQHANKEGVCWPSMRLLEQELGWSDSRIRPALKKLIDGGFVTVEKRKLNGMDQSNVYKLPANIRVSRGKTPVSRGEAMGIPPRDSGYPATGHEPEPIEPENVTTPLPPKKPLPEHGAAQQIVAAYCRAAGIEQPANYRKAVGQAAQLARAGLTADDIPALFAFTADTWKGGADLGNMLQSVDRWRSTAKVARNGDLAKLPWNDPRRMKAEGRLLT